jgi:hypothetical protein
MAKAKPVEVEPRIPDAEFDIPEGIRDGEMGLSSNRTCHPWAMDRLLAFLGAHSAEIINSVAVSNDGKYAELVREGDKLQLFGKL